MEKEAIEEQEKIKAEAELIQAYKLKYGAIEKITSVDENGIEHVLWLKEPTRLTVGLFMATVSENVITACEYIFIDCVIQEISDAAYFQQNAVFYGITRRLQSIIRVKKSTSMTL